MLKQASRNSLRLIQSKRSYCLPSSSVLNASTTSFQCNTNPLIMTSAIMTNQNTLRFNSNNANKKEQQDPAEDTPNKDQFKAREKLKRKWIYWLQRLLLGVLLLVAAGYAVSVFFGLAFTYAVVVAVFAVLAALLAAFN
ncbi:hypothetical protein C9374_001795 [Naegleria lovaniensis]|uniref:Uncharacterized protein n=1 Tax=Naegleria lovaniensis TaxID=51637 RepID=A0AA88GXF1_NAELO|nr:uncharacterized protein C9374_001795 [Naegleria lovaniensis]KAG2387463.1 hypothetical protein C9374_001795 [Naegleria lovaniensis]